MNRANNFCKSCLTCCVISFFVRSSGLLLKRFKTCVFTVVQLYVEMFELVNRLEIYSDSI